MENAQDVGEGSVIKHNTFCSEEKTKIEVRICKRNKNYEGEKRGMNQ